MLKTFFKKETLLVALITACMYTTVYFFERGVATALNIPLDLITITLPTIANDILLFFMFIFPVIIITFLIFKILAKKKVGQYKSKAAFFSGIIYTCMLLPYLDLGVGTIILSIFFGGLYFFFLTLIIGLNSDAIKGVEHSKKDGTVSKDDSVSLESESFLKSLYKNYNFLTNAVLLFFLISFTFSLVGRNSIDVNNFDSFNVGGNKYVIVKIYGDNVFTWQLVDGRLQKKLTYFRLKDLNGITLSAIIVEKR